MKHLFLFLTALCISVPVVSAEPLNKAKQGVEVVTDKHGATIRINGQLFTRYLIDAVSYTHLTLPTTPYV